jgi:hypothetical protein
MSEVEFERLLDVVRTAVAPIPREDCVRTHVQIFDASPSLAPRAANDNAHAWPLLPFPEGWNAVF